MARECAVETPFAAVFGDGESDGEGDGELSGDGEGVVVDEGEGSGVV